MTEMKKIATPAWILNMFNAIDTLDFSKQNRNQTNKTKKNIHNV
jgi:hypothetical protein